MRRRLLTIALLGCALLAAAPAAAEVVKLGHVLIRLDGGFSPHKLPRSHLAPVKVEVEGAISTDDGSQPPPLRELKLELNRHGRISARGLGICRSGDLQSLTTEQALSRCRSALIGHGSFGASFDFGTGNLIGAHGPVLVFNSRREGRPSLLLHFYTGSPVEASLVLPLRLAGESKGEFGIVLRTRVPKLAGNGAITRLKIQLGRTYEYRGKRRSYISASCGAPEGFPGVSFSFLRGTFTFVDQKPYATTLTRDCRVRGR